MVGSEPRGRRKTAATREAILVAAQTLLAEGGTDAVTLPAVSERADISIQTIYNRVGGRDVLLRAVAERAMQANRVYMDRAYGEAGSALHRMLAAADAYTRFARERPHEFRVLLQPPGDDAVSERIADLVAEQNGKLAAAIAAGIAEGQLRDDLDPALTATVLWGALNGVIALSWGHEHHRADTDALLPALFTALSVGLLCSPDS
ncbi:TetR/AcrR family transcriptional regulator [Nocardia testacea]|uniref:TetR/AcrR family transcriptional regulator n=1 Tax=Nocardia testacea TaxID=248551 RepID=UPI003C2B215A